MGNTTSTEESRECLSILKSALNKDLPILNLGHRKCNSHLIDFIGVEEMGSYSVMKWVDMFGRDFFCMKADAVYEDNSRIHLFQTFFKRYVNSDMWVGCGEEGKSLLSTVGGINTHQVNQLKMLLEKGWLIVNDAMLDNLHLHCEVHKNKRTDQEIKLVYIELGYTDT
ncbi:MAG: hypothetical protein Sylvanvirus43_1 [Sylvanvirus sp.]|uniref:Uncharacterized protein n=1 Tax=Sylvanvirus sp. TaxID=2487774 RepID=A0A3G5AJ67_9VIRU|nr:MAG: hypothetical protein Sylvanvirus43_1 [Sylvanvirus sp.]